MGPRGEPWARGFSEKDPEVWDGRKGNRKAAAQDTDTASIWFLPGCMGRGNHRDSEGTKKWWNLWLLFDVQEVEVSLKSGHVYQPHAYSKLAIFLPLCFVIVAHHVYTWGWSETGVLSLNFLPHRLWVDATQFRHFYNYLKEETHELQERYKNKDETHC